jgi:hypothetical protein
LSQATPEFLTAGSALDFEIAPFGLSTVMGKTQKVKLIWFLSSFAGIFSRKTTKSETLRFIFRQFQTKLP